MADAIAELGYRMPAEWEPHEATWIAWPHNQEDWPGKFAAIPWVYAEIVRHLHYSETVNILVNGPAAERQARDVLARIDLDPKGVVFHHVPTDRVWTRDSLSPLVLDAAGQLAIVKWRFNAWAKYDDWKRDDRALGRLWKRGLAARSWVEANHAGDRPVVLEGGSIDVNGRGTLLTTEECLLGKVQERNPGLKRKDYEQLFSRYLGVRKVLWLGKGIVGDDTHGHVDDLARFVNPRTVVVVAEDDPKDANYKSLRENFERLSAMTDQDGNKLEVVKLPMPRPVWFAGQRLPASYANFYIANTVVLVPTFNDPADRVALGTLAELFPDRKVVGIHAVDLVWGLGTLHCLTQQQPREQPQIANSPHQGEIKA